MANKTNLLSLTDSHFHQLTNNCLPWIPIQELNKKGFNAMFFSFLFLSLSIFSAYKVCPILDFVAWVSQNVTKIQISCGGSFTY